MSGAVAAVLAEAVLVVHFAVAAFNILALPLIWLGLWTGWALGRSLRLRLAHLGSMGLTALFAVLDRLCPLTEWESALRQAAGQAGYAGTFVGHWLARLLYVDAPMAVFAWTYAAWAGASLLTWFLAPPRRGRKERAGG